MKYIKENWKFLLFIIICGIIGGIFTGLYTLNSFDQEMIKEAVDQIGSRNLFVVIITLQSVIYAIICGIIGIILSNKIGLWKKIKIEKSKLLAPIIISIIGGLLLIIGDLYIFGSFNDIIKDSYSFKPSFEYILTALIYGGVIEEIMLRLFLMSLIAFVLHKILGKKNDKVSVKILIIANIISALLFAAGHIPATISLFGKMDLLLYIRCFLLNGGLGLAFGWLYRKYGICYSMIAHFGCHLVSKLIWLLFV